MLVALLVAACAGIEPYEPRDHREDGPQKGLFSGQDGEFVIFRRADEPETGSEADKGSDETAADKKQEMGREDKKAGTERGEQ